MKLAIMQPYFFPYIGYFQLINSVDRFVIYDDVNFIKQGWINRNKLLVSGKEYLFSIKLQDASSFRLIKDTEIHDNFYERWKTKFIKSIEINYKSAQYFRSVSNMVEDVLNSESRYISKLATNSLKAVCNYLEIKTSFIDTSSNYQNNHLSGQDRILDICKKEEASHYINSKGGIELYSKNDFREQGTILHFLSPKPTEYRQFKNNFVPWLSIIDVLMFNSPPQVREMLDKYELL